MSMDAGAHREDGLGVLGDVKAEVLFMQNLELNLMRKWLEIV